MGPDITKSERFPTSFQARVFWRRDKEMTNLVDCILELENKLVSKLERNFQDVYQPDTRKLGAMQA
jgi:hypothetical protein